MATLTATIEDQRSRELYNFYQGGPRPSWLPAGSDPFGGSAFEPGAGEPLAPIVAGEALPVAQVIAIAPLVTLGAGNIENPPVYPEGNEVDLYRMGLERDRLRGLVGSLPSTTQSFAFVGGRLGAVHQTQIRNRQVSGVRIGTLPMVVRPQGVR